MDFKFRLALYVTMVIDWILFLKTMTIFSTVELTISNLFRIAGLLFIFSNLNAVQFAVAH